MIKWEIPLFTIPENRSQAKECFMLAGLMLAPIVIAVVISR